MCLHSLSPAEGAGEGVEEAAEDLSGSHGEDLKLIIIR